MTHVGLVLWFDYGLVLWFDYGIVVDSIGIRPGTVLCSSCGMLVWPVWLNVWPGYSLFVAYLKTIVWTILWASLMPQLVWRIKIVIA